MMYLEEYHKIIGISNLQMRDVLGEVPVGDSGVAMGMLLSTVGDPKEENLNGRDEQVSNQRVALSAASF